MKKGIFVPLIVLLALTLITGCGQENKKEAVFIEEIKSVKTTSPIEEVTTAAKDTAVSMETMQVEVEVTGASKQAGELIAADFDSGGKPNNIGGNFGAWDKDPADFSQGCAESFDSVNRYGLKGFGMKLDYDVESDNPAYNGFWMLLQNLDASEYDNLSLQIKGDSDEGYTTVLKIELKNANRQVGRFYITDITDAWKEIAIPFKDFKGITDFSDLTEFVIVFEDRIASNRDGAIYIDDIKFTKNK